MKFTAALLFAVFGSAAAFAPSTSSIKSFASKASAAEDMAGALAPMGFFDPAGIADRAEEKGLQQYHEAEVTDGNVAMLAVVGFLVGEAVGILLVGILLVGCCALFVGLLEKMRPNKNKYPSSTSTSPVLTRTQKTL